MKTLAEIEASTKSYADAHALVADRVGSLNDEVEQIKRRRLAGIRTAVAAAIDQKSVLLAALDESAELFVRPRTVVFHGIKVGFQKGKGGIEWDDDEQVLKLIRKHFPDQLEALIKTTEKPVKDALSNLPAADLKKLGITVVDTGDQVVIKPADSDVDKIVTALLKEATTEVE
jgi:phage host-nuclease inhibitor protein Gam